MDSMLMGVNFAMLINRFPVIGVGGASVQFLEPAILTFEDDARSHSYRTEVAIMQPHIDLANAPSLLGRNVLDNWHMTYFPRADILRFRTVEPGLVAERAGPSLRPFPVPQ
jgi:hypothetical protein